LLFKTRQMESIARYYNNNDGVTLLLLLVVFLVVLLSIIDYKRLRDLVALPFNSLYVIEYKQEFLSAYTIILFIISSLVMSLFIYFAIHQFFPIIYDSVSFLFLYILGMQLLYWGIRYGLEFLISSVFNSIEIQKKAIFIKMSYYHSSALYALVGLIFIAYTHGFSRFFLLITMVIFIILLLIRYYHFIRIYKTWIFSYFFYFILYLCALETAPLFVAAKIGIKLIGQ